jgi:hypothetical protein
LGLEVLISVDQVQISLQVIVVTFHQALNELGSLINAYNNWKNELYATAIFSVEDLCSEWDVTVDKFKKIYHS